MLKECVKSKTLHTLTFKMENGKINHLALFQALELLSHSNITSWYLNIPLIAADFNRIDEMRSYLGMVDLLVIGSEFSGYFDGNYTDGWDFTGSRDEEDLKGLLRDKNKVLQISYNPEKTDDRFSQAIDISKFITHCTGLRGLYLKSLGGKFSNNIKEINLDFPLEDIILKFNNIYYPGSRQCDQGVLKSILSKLKKGIKNLRSLKLLCCQTNRYVPTSMDETEQTDEIDVLGDDLKEISKNSFLEEIEIYDRGLFVGPIRELMACMKNLKKFTLNLGTHSEREKYWDKDFPFDAVRDLEEFRVFINSDVKIPKWGLNLAENLKYMTHKLRVLEIIDGSFSSIRMGVVYGILDVLSRSESIEKLRIEARIDRDVDASDALFSEEVKNLMAAVDVQISQDIKSAIRTMIKRSKNLEMIWIGDFSGFTFDHIEYSKYSSSINGA